jgi:serine acetyltransferase
VDPLDLRSPRIPLTIVDPDGQEWGLRDRTNRPSVRLLLWLGRRRGYPHRSVALTVLRLQRAVAFFLRVDMRTREFGEGLFLPHPFGIVVHARARIGDRVTIYQNVTIGETNTTPGVPTIGDDVLIGAGAVVLGPVTIGDGAVVGANAVVLTDVPAGGLAVGNPARVEGP